MIESLTVRRAATRDLEAIRRIYNEAIEDRVATLDVAPKSPAEIDAWWRDHDDCYAVIVAIESGMIVGWASLNRFSHRCAHAAIADLSVYVARAHRGRGVGAELLRRLEGEARAGGFHKIVLHALDSNELGKRLYRKCGFREVGVFEQHGVIDGGFADVVAMEKLLRPCSASP
ncbi:MAG TPA: arsinothricin resistance N-acetyltransferase ArsN1 family A [Candidatus Cybelea sp.]